MQKYCLLIWLFVFVVVNISYADEKDLVVGVIAPMSGDLAQYGTAVVNGMHLADNSIKGLRLRIVIEDNPKCDSPDAVTAFYKLITLHQAKVIVTVCTAAAQGVMPLARARSVPLIQLTESGPDPDNVMLKLMPDSIRMATLLGEMYKKKYKRLAIIGTDSAVNVGERGNIPLVSKAFESLGGTVVLSELFSPELSDFRSLILRIRKSGAEAVTPFISSASGMALFLKQSDELKLWRDVNLAGNFFFEFLFPELTKLYSPLFQFDNLESVNLAQASESSFKKEYEARYHSTVPQFADYAYDAVNILKHCGVNQKCYGSLEHGASGPLKFDANGRRVGVFDVKMLKKGVFVTIQTTP